MGEVLITRRGGSNSKSNDLVVYTNNLGNISCGLAVLRRGENYFPSTNYYIESGASLSLDAEIPYDTNNALKSSYTLLDGGDYVFATTSSGGFICIFNAVIGKTYTFVKDSTLRYDITIKRGTNSWLYERVVTNIGSSRTSAAYPVLMYGIYRWE